MIVLRKTESDFLLWCKDIVPRSLADRKAYKRHELDPHEDREHYNDVQAVLRQLKVIRCSLSPLHSEFFEIYLLGGKPYERTHENIQMYRDIFFIWRTVCFPNGALAEQTFDNVVIGKRLKALRLEKLLGPKRAAELLGIAVKTLYAYEEGKCQVRLETLYKFSRLYGFKLDDFLTQNGIITLKEVDNSYVF